MSEWWIDESSPVLQIEQKNDPIFFDRHSVLTYKLSKSDLLWYEYEIVTLADMSEYFDLEGIDTGPINVFLSGIYVGDLKYIDTFVAEEGQSIGSLPSYLRIYKSYHRVHTRLNVDDLAIVAEKSIPDGVVDRRK